MCLVRILERQNDETVVWQLQRITDSLRFRRLLCVNTAPAKQSNFYFLTQAGYVVAVQLMWACGITACARRITSEYSFTDLGKMDS